PAPDGDRARRCPRAARDVACWVHRARHRRAGSRPLMGLRNTWLPALLLSVLSLPGHAVEDTGQTLARSAAAPLQGRAIPPLMLTTIDGDSLDLGALRGRKALYLEFWATWCTP